MTSISGTPAIPGLLTDEQYLAALDRDAARIVAIAPQDLDAPVPPCPGWTVREAVLHTGEVYSHKVMCLRLRRRPDDWDHGPQDGADPVGWFKERYVELVTELRSRGADAPSYTWHEQHQTAGFWYRRMAQETAVHRVDVESAFADMTPVEHELAIDGIDEVLDWFLAYQAEDVGPNGPGSGTVAVRTGDHIWRSTLTLDTVELSREPGPADAVVSGEPSELLLWLWGRRPDWAVSREGDEELIRALRERLRAVTQ